MKVHIDLVGQQMVQGIDCPYEEDIDITLEDAEDNCHTVVITIDRKEYHIDKSELKKALDTLG